MSDPNKKAIYDRYGHEGLKNGGGESNFHFGGGFGVDPFEIFKEFFGDDDGFFGFGKSKKKKNPFGFGFDDDDFFGSGFGSGSSFSSFSSSSGGFGGFGGTSKSVSTSTTIK